jgi:tetratricopeptide (TPR) repeat protein
MKSTSNISFDDLQLLAENKLSPSKADEILAAIEKDADLKATYEGIVLFLENETSPINGFIESSRKKLNTKKPLQELDQKTKKSQKLIYLFGSIAAIFIIGLFIVRNIDSDPSNYDFQDAGLAVTLSVNQNNLAEAMNAYKQADFVLAEQLLDIELIENPKNDTLLYYKAVVFKKQEKYEPALLAFNKITMKSEFTQKVEFQKGMCYWYLGNNKEAKTIFTNIVANKTHAFKDKAEKALVGLE